MNKEIINQMKKRIVILGAGVRFRFLVHQTQV